jgi:hypothetical protein
MTINGRGKGLNSQKLDSLLKHAKRFKGISIYLPKMGLKVGNFYQNKECAHASNNVLLPQILNYFVL